MAGATDKLPLVSIFCVCKDGQQTIRRCVESVLNQDYPNIEFVVQDGASTDGTLEILREYGDKIKLVSEPDSGPAEGFFRVLKRCSGDIIGSCLSDEELLPHAVNWAVNNFAKLPDVAAIYGNVYMIDAVGNIIGEFNAGPFDFARYLCHEIVPPFSASFFRRYVLETIGLKERKWALDCGEFELWIRLGVNFQIRHISEFVSKFGVHSGSDTQKASTYFELIKGRLKIMDRFFNDLEIPQEIRPLRPRAFAGLHLWVSESLRSLNEMAEARRQVKKALKYQPNPERLAGEVRALCNYGGKLLQNGSIAESLDYFDLSQEAKLHIPNVNYFRAVAFAQLGRLEEAQIAAEAEIAINSEHKGAKQFLEKMTEHIRASLIELKSDEDNYEQEKADVTGNKVCLSVIVTARNDNHGGNLLQRMQLFVNGLLAQSEKYKLATELIFVEWNPPQDKPRLAEALGWPKAHNFCAVRIIEVPHEIHNRYEHSQNLALYQMIAKNVGLRRARGRFCLSTNIDILFSDELYAFLASGKVAKGKMYRVNRYDVKENALPELLNNDLLSFCRKNIIRIYEKNGTKSLKTDNYHKVSTGLFTNACGDFQLMAREHWYTLRGYPEFDMFSFHLDSILEFMAYFSGIAEEILPDPMRIYHIDHSSGWSPEIQKDNILENRLKRDNIPQLLNEEFQTLCVEMAQKKRSFIFNDENWGLGSDKLNETVILGSKWDDQFQMEHTFIPDSVVTERQNDLLPQTSSGGKYLSIVVTARNDDHGENMLHRLQIFINVFCHQCIKYGLDAELIIVEWNPPHDKERISQVIDWPNELSPLSVRFIEVPLEIHDQVGNADKIPLFQMIAKNVGIRRATGKFVLSTNIDIIFSDELMWFLSRKLLAEDKFYRICRYDVRSKKIPKDITTSEQLEFCRNDLVRVQGLNGTRDLNKSESESEFQRRRDKFIKLSDNDVRAFINENGKEKKLFTNACGDFTLMSKDKWLSFKCHPELPLGAMYVDGLVLYMAYVSELRQYILPDPMRIYHIEHGRSAWSISEKVEGQNLDCERKRPSLDYQSQYLPWCHQMLSEKRPLNPNAENWGLKQHELKEYTVCGTRALSENRGKNNGDTHTSDIFHKWINKFELFRGNIKYNPVTIFTMPKPFKGHIDIIQRNAIKSWTLLQPQPEIILLGDDEGTSEIAREFSLKHVPDVERNEFGTPLLNSMFAVAETHSNNSILAYVNADIILMSDFARAIEAIRNHGIDKFLMVGQRWDVHLPDLIDFNDDRWEAKLKGLVTDKGTLHEVTGVDYFVFRKRTWGNIPPFALGRTVWDNWLIKGALDLKMDVIDATRETTVVHQAHEYAHIKGGESEAWNGAEAKTNLALAGGYDNIKSIAYAGWEFQDGRLIEKVPALNDRGEEFYKSGDLVKALAAFKNAIEIDSNDPRGYSNIGILCRDTGNTEAATRFFQKAREVDPDDAEILAKTETLKIMESRGRLVKKRLNFFQICSFYKKYIIDFYKNNPHLGDAKFDEQISALLKDGFSGCHMFAPHMKKFGYDPALIIGDCPPAQAQWAREHGLTLDNPKDWIRELARKQIEILKPDVLLLSHPVNWFDSGFLQTLSWRPSLVIGWRAASIPLNTDWSMFDVVLSHLAVCRKHALKIGAKSVEHFFPGFPSALADALKSEPKKYDVVFTGQWTQEHRSRNEFIKQIAKGSKRNGKFSKGFFISAPPDGLPPEIAQHNQGARWGIEMHRVLKQGRIVVNAEIDMARGDAGNLRLFETTGTGSFLLTEHQDNIQQYFEPGLEIETFRNAGELLEKIDYYLAHPEQREAVARRGQERCLREYSIEQRAAALDGIIRTHLRKKYEQAQIGGHGTSAVQQIGGPKNQKRRVAQLGA